MIRIATVFCSLLLLFPITLPAQLSAVSDPGRHLEYGRRYLENNEFTMAEQEFLKGLQAPDLTPGEESELEELLKKTREALSRSRQQRLNNIDQKVRYVRDLRQREASAIADISSGRTGITDESLDPTLRRVNELARSNGKQAFAYRLVTLADLEREQGRLQNALILSTLGLRYADDETKWLAEQTFYEVARDSFTHRISLSGVPAEVSYSSGFITLLKSDSLIRFSVQDGRQVFGYSPVSQLVLDTPDLLVFSDNETVFRWRPGWQAPRVLNGKSMSPKSALPCENEQTLISDKIGTLTLWSRDDREVAAFKEHEGDVFQLHGKEDSFISRGMDGSLRWWKNREVKKVIRDPKGGYLYNFIPLSSGFAVPTSSGNILLGDYAESPLKIIPHGPQAVVELRLLGKEGNRLLSRSLDGTVKAWSDTGEPLFELANESSILDLVDNPNEGEIVVWTETNEIAVYAADSGQKLMTTSLKDGEIRQICKAGDKGKYLIRQKNGLVKIFDRDKGVVFSGWSGAADVQLPLLLTEDLSMIIDFDVVGQLLQIMPSVTRVRNEILSPGFPENAMSQTLIDYFDLAQGLEFFTSPD